MRTHYYVRAGTEGMSDKRLHLFKGADMHLSRIFVTRLPFEDSERRRDHCAALNNQLKDCGGPRRIEVDEAPYSIPTFAARVVISKHCLPILLSLAQREEGRPEGSGMLNTINAGPDRVCRIYNFKVRGNRKAASVCRLYRDSDE